MRAANVAEATTKTSATHTRRVAAMFRRRTFVKHTYALDVNDARCAKLSLNFDHKFADNLNFIVQTNLLFYASRIFFSSILVHVFIHSLTAHHELTNFQMMSAMTHMHMLSATFD